MTEAHGVSTPTATEIKTVLQKAQQGDSTVLPALRTWLDRSPGACEAMGNLATIAREALIESTSGEKNLVAREAFTRKCAALTTELAGPTPVPLERLLVERIVLCWLQLYTAEALYTQMKDLSFRQDDFYQRRISTAQARYLTAIRTLAQMRRVGLPALQINVAGQQVNVAG